MHPAFLLLIFIKQNSTHYILCSHHMFFDVFPLQKFSRNTFLFGAFRDNTEAFARLSEFTKISYLASLFLK